MRVRRAGLAIALAAALVPPASGSAGAHAGDDPPAAPEEAVPRVLVISVDGLVPSSLRRLGPERRRTSTGC